MIKNESISLLRALGKTLKEKGCSAFILPKTDPHRSEFTLEEDNYLQFISHFTGSAGLSFILTEGKSALFVDGRYTAQARTEVDPNAFECLPYTGPAVKTWAKKHMPKGEKVGFDPFLLSQKEYDRFKDWGLTLIPLESNPIADLWTNRPSRPPFKLVPHPLDYVGVPFPEKLKEVQRFLREKKADGLFLNSPESIAWLFNIRAPERPTTPAAGLYAYVPQEGISVLFAHPEQILAPLTDHLEPHVTTAPYDQTFLFLKEQALKGQSIYCDPDHVTIKAISTLKDNGGTVLTGEDPCALPKACKNPTEIEGMRQAHQRDGVAVCTTLAWLDEQMVQGTPLTEIDVVTWLLKERSRMSLFQGPSFKTIAASGPHGAIIHYHPTPATNRPLKNEELLLLDSGGQYLDGTTDITRTICLNKNPSPEEKDRFTRVLKGHIALAHAQFPEGTSGSQLDILARLPLWEMGCDYAHGTGHGVGSYLGVHEGPQSISLRPNTVALKPGMVLSNEPGYYKEDHYGIRIESLVLVVPVNNAHHEKPFLKFETLTLVPIDLSLIERVLLTSEEIDWINAYHTHVRKTLSPLVGPETRKWLERATVKI
jgi:Xaa-Pro aminopeptidase